MMPSSSERLRALAADLAWSLWAELGVSGWERHHSSHAIDPEALILFTLQLGDTDPRLRDESIDWCITYGRYISGARLKNLLADVSDTTRSSFGRYAATVGAHSNVRWAGATKARRYVPTRRSKIRDFRTASTISLRARAIFGVNAKAEIIYRMLADPTLYVSAADLVADTAYTKRNLSEALDALRMSGVLDALPVRNQIKYRLADPTEMSRFVGKLPEQFPRWRFVFRVMTQILDGVDRLETKPAVVARVEADRLARAIREDLAHARLSEPSLPRTVNDADVLLRWAVDLFEILASGKLTSHGAHARTTALRRR